jgi:hypothetical protein
MITKPTPTQLHILTTMRDGNVRLLQLVSNQGREHISLDDPTLPTFARSVPLTTFQALRYHCWVEFESETVRVGGVRRYFKLSAIGREAIQESKR